MNNNYTLSYIINFISISQKKKKKPSTLIQTTYLLVPSGQNMGVFFYIVWEIIKKKKRVIMNVDIIWIFNLCVMLLQGNGEKL